MSHPQISASEAARISDLKSYNILDSLTEEDYEEITCLASVICQVPVALISFVDEKRQWFKSHRGFEITETSREYSFCAHALNNPNHLMIVPDSRLDDRFKNNPLVTGEPHIVFYAGFPLVSDAGYALGTVCVLDRTPRYLTADQEKALKIVASQVMTLLKTRKLNAELEVVKKQLEIRNKDLDQFAMIVAHDIKSPLATVLSSNELLADICKTFEDDDVLALIDASYQSAKKIRSLVDGILSYHRGGSGDTTNEAINLPQLLESCKQTISSPKPFTITYILAEDTIIFNKTQLEQVFFNLINNSIRYNTSDIAEIIIRCTHHEGAYQFSISDNGIGIPPEHQQKVFDLYTTLFTRDTFGLRGSGIGLPTVKRIIENAGGSISVASEEGGGTTFSFTIPERNLHQAAATE